MAVVMNGATEEEEEKVLKSPTKNENNNNNNKDLTIYTVFNNLIQSFIITSEEDDDPNMKNKKKNKSLVESFREAILNTRRDILIWTRQGASPLRSLLVLSAGIVILLALTGMLAFMLFVIVATVNAIVISSLISLAAVGGGLAIFFFCLTVIYIAMLFVATFVTFTVTVSAIIAALFAAGWIGFIWMVWLAVSKCAHIAKSYARHAYTPANVSDEGSTTVKEAVATSN
ncbi:hypothetical protein Tco_1373445 [Tanacetum coccineum]